MSIQSRIDKLVEILGADGSEARRALELNLEDPVFNARMLAHHVAHWLHTGEGLDMALIVASMFDPENPQAWLDAEKQKHLDEAASARTMQGCVKTGAIQTRENGNVPFAIITMPSNKLVAQIHDRMPAILEPAGYERWLGLEPYPHDLLITHPSEPMTMWPISTRVNKPENDDASLLDRTGPLNVWAPLKSEGALEQSSFGGKITPLGGSWT